MPKIFLTRLGSPVISQITQVKRLRSRLVISPLFNPEMLMNIFVAFEHVTVVR